MICGVDCGQNGALALLDRLGAPLQLVDMPAVKVKIGRTWRKRTDPHGLRALLDEWRPAHVVIEEVSPRHGDGPRAVTLGIGYGEAVGVVVGMGLSLVIVPAAQWRRETGVSADNYDERKAKSLRVARDLFPSMAGRLKAASHSDRAEALLIARWGLRARALGVAA